MYVDGHLIGSYGETHKVSALETLQFSTIGVIEDASKCVTMDCKVPGDLVYILGTTCIELGASEYYEHFGYTGLNVPRVRPEACGRLYRALAQAIAQELVASAHGIYRGGLGVHLALVAMGGNLGLDIELARVPRDGIDRNDGILFSESAGRFIVSINPAGRERFENLFKGLDCACVGTVTETPDVVIRGIAGNPLASVAADKLKAAWKEPFGELI